MTRHGFTRLGSASLKTKQLWSPRPGHCLTFAQNLGFSACTRWRYVDKNDSTNAGILPCFIAWCGLWSSTCCRSQEGTEQYPKNPTLRKTYLFSTPTPLGSLQLPFSPWESSLRHIPAQCRQDRFLAASVLLQYREFIHVDNY